MFFEKTQNNDLFISPKRENTILEMTLKSLIIANLTTRCQKVENRLPDMFSKLLAHLIG